MEGFSPRTEFELIDWLRQQARRSPQVTTGIGDDAAVLSPLSKPLVVTTDMLMEGVDFLCPPASAVDVGYKSLAVNLSDLAAMAARPTAVFVAVAAPRTRGPEFFADVMRGVMELANQWQVTLAGGDTDTWDGPLVISLAALGEPFAERPVLRSGAQPGDWLLVTGSFGGSLQSGRHLRPTPRIAEAARLVDLAPVHALIDVSDGLAADLHHLLDSSRVGAELRAVDIPIHSDARANGANASPLDRALSDGEDFELIAAVAPDAAARVLAEWDLPTPLTKIGEVTSALGCRLTQPDGSTIELPPRGWRHEWTG